MSIPYFASHGERIIWMTGLLSRAGVDDETIGDIRETDPASTATGEFAADSSRFRAHWTRTDDLQRRLGGPASADPATRDAILALRDHACDSRARFLARHAEAVYRKITVDFTHLMRVEDVVAEAGRVVPGLTPTADDLAAEEARPQGDKIGFEMQQGMLLSALFAVPGIGRHICHAMLLPRPESLDARERYLKAGRLDLDKASVERRGGASVVTLRHPETLNAEDDSTTASFETAVDLALMDPETGICVLRGGQVQHPKYAGRRLFSAGINLTGLYWGRIPFMFYITRDLGLLNKMHRGLARADRDPSEIAGGTREKLWVAGLEGFAIGGGCQLLLVCDYILAEAGAYMTLPARKEGIIPGMANLRLPRFVGDRIARQAIMYERRLDADSPEGRMVCDEIVPAGGMDAALDRVAQDLTSSGMVSAEGNRRVMRVGQESVDDFCEYLAAYAREQAYCHASPALTDNLERNWNAKERKVA